MDYRSKRRFGWLAYVWYTIRHRGLVRTCAMGYREWLKERELGIRTLGMAEPSPCPTLLTGPDGGHMYQPSSSVLFAQAVAALPFSVAGLMLLDVGSGKGRAMVLAAEAGFGRVVGVEYDPVLSDVAQVNMERVRSRFPYTGFELHEGDAVAFGLPVGTDVAYLFNPFDRETLRRWLEAIVPKVSGVLHIIYMHPVYAEEFDRTEGVAEVARHPDAEFIIYRAVKG